MHLLIVHFNIYTGLYVTCLVYVTLVYMLRGKRSTHPACEYSTCGILIMKRYSNYYYYYHFFFPFLKEYIHTVVGPFNLL